MFNTPYIQQRLQKADSLRQAGKNPYDNQVQRTLNNAAFLEKFSDLHSKDEPKDPNSVHALVGRVRFMRLMGKACFIKIEDQSALLQVYLSQNDLGKEGFEDFKKCVEVGDIVNVIGYPFVTKTEELSLHATACKILTKAIVPLPEKFHGLSDIELRYRQRYVDLIANPEVKEVFKTRSKIVATIRRFFEEKGFLEVETPMMHPIAGGANARPFITYHNALEVERYLRIAPELYLKRLVVGGFEAVFEINRNFRNEGMDHSHNPEFTMLEFYWAYKTYEDLITLTKELFSTLLNTLNLPAILTYQEHQIDFNAVRVLGFKEALEQVGGLSKDTINDPKKLQAYLKKEGVRLEGVINHGKLLAEAFDLCVEGKLINPTFITEYPIEISPLARRNDTNPDIADRFELFIAGKEIANGFSELNDPIDQYGRFEEQVRAKESGDEEAQFMDTDYVWALGHGMPPTAGEGIGIDRLVMLLTNSKTIKDVILFPAMKPENKDNHA
ncbi:Lysyl-tRNA synthetase LysS [Helicobacter sp. NHP19-012]|uniref:Lysine--tRNA ligase n=1 Tax=Helicobacter gastrofelis TaxID=2849642 RepID=A0ABM7SD64_9HELI|nr:lysine--tRNA ligase [Helicobacter sp. NHP19-012]BCZ18365.1 Lysyl-tRNA synthetase LysS [Helicobacter sp. NHP19-012]